MYSERPESKAEEGKRRLFSQKIEEKFGDLEFYEYLCTRISRSGALDEWLSQRSAKPSTAVRIRQAPQKKEG